MRLLQRDGYAATSWRGVVNEAGTPWGSAYHHFPGGKEELAVAALALGSQHVVDMLEASLAEGSTVADGIRRWFDAIATGLTDSQFRGGCPIATVALETAPESAVLTAACAGAFDSWRGIIATALTDAGLAPGRAAEFATLVVTNLEGALVLARVSQNVAPLQLARGAVLQLLSSELS